jgi:hypothetical protein
MSQIRRNPGAPARATSTTPLADTKSIAHRRQDGFAAPGAEDRADAEVIEAARARGFKLAVPCRVCGRMLTARQSVDVFVGPVCASRVVADV